MENKKMDKKDLNIIASLMSDKCRNCYTGQGRYTHKSADYVKQAENLLISLGFRRNIDFTIGNDAPKGGWQGNYCKLTENCKKSPILNDCMKNLSDIEKVKNEKLLSQNRTKWENCLVECCQKRLVCESKNGKKRLNGQIRQYASNLGIDLTSDDFHTFVEITAGNQYYIVKK